MKYSKPTISRVDLVPQEATLSACKAVDGFWNCWFGQNCSVCFECYAVGS